MRHGVVIDGFADFLDEVGPALTWINEQVPTARRQSYGGFDTGPEREHFVRTKRHTMNFGDHLEGMGWLLGWERSRGAQVFIVRADMISSACVFVNSSAVKDAAA